MGLNMVTTCIFTGYEALPIMNSVDATDYFVTVNKKQHLIQLPSIIEEITDNQFFKENRDVFFALLYNDDWFKDERHTYITIDELKSLVDQKNIPISPEDKLEKLFISMFSKQKTFGNWVSIFPMNYEEFWRSRFFNSQDELTLYLEALISRGLIEAVFNTNVAQPRILDRYRMTFGGVNYLTKLQTEGDNSTKCFVAMAFSPETRNIRQAIKDAIIETGFEPIIIDEKHIDSDKTINDEIIASLKRCKFCIADFTFHRNGVYFESGFALGQGKKVIYTCREDDFKNAHFDIKPLQHIIYTTTEQLKNDLINKIEAWIK